MALRILRTCRLFKIDLREGRDGGKEKGSGAGEERGREKKYINVLKHPMC